MNRIHCYSANRTTVKALRDLLREYGHEYLVADSGQIAREGDIDFRSPFGGLSKYQQLLTMKGCGVTTTLEDQGTGMYVVRPHRHSRGVDFRVTSVLGDYDPSTHYHTNLFPKKWEYRVLGVGNTTMTILKDPPSGSRMDEAWGEDSRWIGVYNPINDRILNHTNVHFELERFWRQWGPPLLWGADVLLSEDYKYAVCEMNMAPAVEVPRHREFVIDNLLPLIRANERRD